MNESYWPSKCRKIEISGSFSRKGPNFQRRPNFQTQAFVENMRYAEYDDDDGYVPLGVTSLWRPHGVGVGGQKNKLKLWTDADA